MRNGYIGVVYIVYDAKPIMLKFIMQHLILNVISMSHCQGELVINGLTIDDKDMVIVISQEIWLQCLSIWRSKLWLRLKSITTLIHGSVYVVRNVIKPNNV